ncbi:radical SAM/SPASM domain-containing protein [Clostridium sp. HCP1S3_B4]|uniref:radical SAM/SPASM domain-containing protein n=1 Tax=unclassified Clostridium TaxID=2614128 RepID=UPI0016B9EBDD|nr:radical SAM/SPASM domain-containing protein [Clostridiales bacterium]MDY2729188.1 radical SAM/SPASM domain-containing protein [Clostridium sp.]NLK23073.1 radical SAM protein [Clostridiales bacterium]
MKKYKRIYIEITNICNLNCHFCPKTKRKYKFMNIKEFEKILYEIKPYTDYIFFHLMGEPLLNDNIGDFLELSYKMGFKVNLTTNGTLINNRKNILLESKALRQINFSLHSFEANDNEIDFYEYVNNIISFVKEAKSNTNIISALRLWNFNSSILKGENNLNEDIINIIKNEFSYNGDLLEKLNKNNSVKISDRIYINGAEKFSWPNINIQEISDRGFCYGIRSHVGILVDGTVVPCCLDSEGNIPLGNIFEKDFESIINGDRAKNMFNGFSQRKKIEKLCRTCGYSTRF